MKKLYKAVMKNPITSVLILLVWIVYFLAYDLFHYNGIKDTTQVILALVISFCFAVFVTCISLINIFFIPAIREYMTSKDSYNTLFSWLDKNLSLENVVSSKLSARVMGICFSNFVNEMMVFIVCYFYKLQFKTFIWISLAVIIVTFISNFFYIKHKNELNRNKREIPK